MSVVIPKYARVQSGIINLIASGNIKKEGLLPTEKELAKRFDVSIITVRRAVSNLEKMKIVRRVQGSGTFVTSSIPGKIDNGNIIYLTVNRDLPRFSNINSTADIMNDSFLLRGYHLQILVAERTLTSSVVKTLRKAKGVIVTGWITKDWITILNALNLPVVLIGSVVIPGLKVPYVDYDWKKMAAMLTKHLLADGSRRIGLIIGGRDYGPTPLMRDGYRLALKKEGVKFNPDIIFYSEEEEAPLQINEFLKKHNDLDGLLIERGCYVHVVNSLFNTTHRPRMGVMSASGPGFGKICENIVDAFFNEDIYDKSVNLLLQLMESNTETVKSVKIEPYMLD